MGWRAGWLLAGWLAGRCQAVPNTPRRLLARNQIHCSADSMSDNRTQSAPRKLVLRLGQGPPKQPGDLQGSDSVAIQAGIDYLHRLGGGTLELGPGVYTMRNCVYPPPIC